MDKSDVLGSYSGTLIGADVPLTPHRSSQGSKVVTFGGLRVSSPEQTFIDLATELSLVDLVVFGEAA